MEESGDFTKPSFARANGIEICYQSLGDPASPPLVLIAGLGAQLINWRDDFCGRFVGRGYRVIRFDNRDVGLSSKFDAAGVPDIGRLTRAKEKGEPVSAPYSIQDMAQDTVELLDSLRIDSAHFLGSSMGGRIAQMIAIHHPKRIRTLTCVMSSMGEPGYPSPDPDALSLLFEPAPGDREGYIQYMLRVARVLAGRMPPDESLVEERAGRAFDRSFNREGVGRQLAALTVTGGARGQLRSIRTPTLVIHGSDDPLIPVDCAKDMADTIPDSKLLIIDGMGHGLSDTPELWPRVIDAVSRHAV